MNHPFRMGMSAYRDVDIKSRVASSDQHDLVLLMFDGLLESLMRAKGAVANRDTQTKVSEIARAIRILQEGLLSSLDLDKGGEIAHNLSNLYEYCVIRLTEANAKNSLEALDEVSELIKSIADAWRQMRAGTPGAKDSDSSMADEAPAKPSVPPAARRVSHAYSAGLSLQGA